MNRSEISRLLKSQGSDQEKLFECARCIRENEYSNKVFIRGVIEISNLCRRNCNYCGMRHNNCTLPRYLMSAEEIVDTATIIHRNGIRILFLQSGENEFTTDIVLKAIRIIKQKLGMDIILCLGNKSREEYRVLKNAGADGYILKHETSNQALHKEHRGCSLDERLQCTRDLLDLGFKVGGGNIVGLPNQSIQSIAEDILLAKSIGVHFVSASPFIPHERSPLGGEPISSGGDLVFNTMAVMSLLLNVPIPTVSALDLVKENGQLFGFSTGANVITVNFTPEKYKTLYSLYSSRRPDKTLSEIKSLVHQAGLNTDHSDTLIKGKTTNDRHPQIECLSLSSVCYPNRFAASSASP